MPLLFAAAAAAWAVSGETPEEAINRPLRAVQPAEPFPLPAAHRPEPPAAAPSLLTAAALEQPLTKRYIAEYSSPAGIAWLNRTIQNGGMYFPFIREEIAKRKLPPELLYLPVIESGYLASAKSKSGAVGLWQFMLNSIAPFDMRVTELVDERRDFRKSTSGALQKLEENFRFLGSWPLALAAYNSGLGGVNRAAQRGKTRDYWQLCEQKELRSETIHYVPKLLAVSYIMTQPRRFALDYWPRPAAWTAVTLDRQASLDIIAAETGIDAGLLRRLNAELLHGVTPPDKTYQLKIPLEQAGQFAALLEREDLKLLQFHRHSVQYGDTLSALARRYGASLAAIEQHNPGVTNRYLKIGETITIPAAAEAEAPAKSGPEPEAGAEPAFTGSHQVKKGETLWSLAVRYRVSPGTLARENGMELNQILPEGKTLKVPIIEESGE